MKANQPNFERIISLLNEARPQSKAMPYFIKNAPEGADLVKLVLSFSLIQKKIDEISSQIQRGEFPSGKLSENLEALLSEFNLESLKEDFLLLGQIINSLQSLNQESKIFLGVKEENSLFFKELIQALKFFNQKKQIKVTFKDMESMDSVSIKDKFLISIIHEQLFNHLGNYHVEIQPEEIQDWGEFLSWLEESNPAKKGRPEREMFSGFLIDLLQKYLQRHTEIKADLGIELSRRQASFIGQYLSSIGIIEDNQAWLEDNIRHTFKNYRSKAKSK
jgi:hypothetical protein